MTNYDEQIRDLEYKINLIKEKKDKLASMPIEHRLADTLHGKMCHWNHTDGCGYHYEKWDKPGTEKNLELTRIERIISALEGDVSYAEAVIEAL